MSVIASQITILTFVYSTVYSRRRSKKTSKLRFTGLCAGNSPVTDEFPAQRASNAENVSIWWRHHDIVRLWLHFLFVSLLYVDFVNLNHSHKSIFVIAIYPWGVSDSLHCYSHVVYSWSRGHSATNCPIRQHSHTSTSRFIPPFDSFVRINKLLLKINHTYLRECKGQNSFIFTLDMFYFDII